MVYNDDQGVFMIMEKLYKIEKVVRGQDSCSSHKYEDVKYESMDCFDVLTYWAAKMYAVNFFGNLLVIEIRLKEYKSKCNIFFQKKCHTSTLL